MQGDKTRKISVKVGFTGNVSSRDIRKVLAEKLMDAIEEDIYYLMKVEQVDDFFIGDKTYTASIDVFVKTK